MSPPIPTTACQAGSLSSRSCSTSAPSRTLTTGFATDTVATAGTSFPVDSESCWKRNPTIPAIAMTQSSQPEEDSPDSVGVQVLDDRLHERRRGAVEHPGDRSEDRSARRRTATVREHHEGATGHAEHEDRRDPVGSRRVVHARGRIGEACEHGEADDDDRGAEHVPRRDLLAGQEVPERRRPDHGRDEERLDDRHPPPVERGRLQADAQALRGETGEPHPRGEQRDQRPRPAETETSATPSAARCQRVAASAKKAAAAEGEDLRRAVTLGTARSAARGALPPIRARRRPGMIVRVEAGAKSTSAAPNERGPAARRARTSLAHPGCGGREPEPGRRERRAPDIAQAFDSSQTTLNLIAVGYSLGLAASVLYLGAIGDRYGPQADARPRTPRWRSGVPLAAWAPSDDGPLRPGSWAVSRRAWRTRRRSH